MRQLPDLPGTPGDMDSPTDDEAEPAPRHRRKMLKSGMDRTGATTIPKKITWPHEDVYTSAGKPTSYQDNVSASVCVWISPSHG